MEIKKSFTRGVMDMGTDARLIADGVYRYAVNIDVAGSESSDQGVIQNIRGNIARGTNINVLEENTTIGVAKDEANNRIYYFWVSDDREGIYEYDVSAENALVGGGTINRILEFSKKEGPATSKLNFSLENLITGAVVVDNLLIWTDGFNPVRKINLDRFRGSGVWEWCEASNFNEENIICPEGTYSEPAVNGGVETRRYIKSSIDPTHDGQGNLLVNLQSDDPNVDIITSEAPFAGDLLNLAKRPPLFPPRVIHVANYENNDGLSENYQGKVAKPEDKLYSTFARFAIRYRYADGETSAFSPFSSAAFMPKDYSVNSETGVLESMVNRMAEVKLVFDIGEDEVKEIDIIYKESDSSSTYLVDTIYKNNYPELNSSTHYKREIFEYNYDGSKIYRILPSSELTRIYDNVPITAKALDLAGNRLVLGNFKENYTFSVVNEDGVEITPDYEVSLLSENKADNPTKPFRTLKTGRDYQVGVVYLDQEGRQSPVIVSENNSVNVPYSKSTFRNRLQLKINNEAPYWATHYRPFIKQTKGISQNIIPIETRYIHDDNKYYVHINDSDINKAEIDDILVRKIYNGDTIKNQDENEVEYWRVVEAKRLVKTEGQNFDDVKLPDSIDDDMEGGYYLTLVPSDDTYRPAADIARDIQSVWETIPGDNLADIYYETSETFRIINGKHTTLNVEVGNQAFDSQILADVRGDTVTRPIELTLNWNNAYGYGYGVEAMVIEDKFNGVALDQGARASTVQEDYRQYDKESWLIHSGVFVDATSLNRLNEFNISLPIQKELDINDGSIQKLHFRDTNLIAFQERKVKNIPINKNVIVTADGGNITTAGSQFFGTESSYAGEYGIAKNPESFSTYGNRIYFADKNSGAVLRLSNDGLTEISKNGVEAYVRKNIADATYIKTFYNDYADELDVSFQNLTASTTYSGNRANRRIAGVGSIDPGRSCRQVGSELDYETVYAITQSDAVDTDDLEFLIGDSVYSDSQFRIPFRGNLEWYRVEYGSGTEASYRESIQIDNFGSVVAVVKNCNDTFGEKIDHMHFNLSEEVFQDELDACTNGVLNDIAFFGPGSGQDLGDLGSEPNNGNYIYDSDTTLTRSNRTGWFKINTFTQNLDGTYDFDYYAIEIHNGIVERNPFNCERVEKGRTRFEGSRVLAPGEDHETLFDRHYRICLAEIEEGWWIDSDRGYPVLGDTVYKNNFTDDVDTAGFINVGNGTYLTVDSSGEITDISDCAEIVCTIEPEKYLAPSTNVPFIQEAIPLVHVSTEAGVSTFTINANVSDYKVNDYYELDSNDDIQYRTYESGTQQTIRVRVNATVFDDPNSTLDFTFYLRHIEEEVHFHFNSDSIRGLSKSELAKVLSDRFNADPHFESAVDTDDNEVFEVTWVNNLYPAGGLVHNGENLGFDYRQSVGWSDSTDLSYSIPTKGENPGTTGGSTCTAGDANCFKNVKNDIYIIDKPAFEHNDPVRVTLKREDSDNNVDYVNFKGRIVEDGDDLTIRLRDDEGVATDDYTWSIQNLENLYKFEFFGVDITTTLGDTSKDVKIGFPSAQVKWFEKGVKRYPAHGTIDQSFTDFEEVDDTEEFVQGKHKLSRATEDTLTDYDVEVGITELCYDKQTGTAVEYVKILTTKHDSPFDATYGACENTTNDVVYYDPNINKQYYTNASLDASTLFDTGAGYYGVAYDSSDDADNVNVTHIEYIDDNGRPQQRQQIFCDYQELHNLSYGSNLGAACDNWRNGVKVQYWGDDGDLSEITTLRLRHGGSTIAQDGFYYNGQYAIEIKNGVKTTGTRKCPVKCTNRLYTLGYSSSVAEDACKRRNTRDVWTLNPTITSGNKMYDSCTSDQTKFADSGFYADGTSAMRWNKQLGQWDINSVISCIPECQKPCPKTADNQVQVRDKDCNCVCLTCGSKYYFKVHNEINNTTPINDENVSAGGDRALEQEVLDATDDTVTYRIFLRVNGHKVTDVYGDEREQEYFEFEIGDTTSEEVLFELDGTYDDNTDGSTLINITVTDDSNGIQMIMGYTDLLADIDVYITTAEEDEYTLSISGDGYNNSGGTDYSNYTTTTHTEGDDPSTPGILAKIEGDDAACTKMHIDFGQSSYAFSIYEDMDVARHPLNSDNKIRVTTDDDDMVILLTPTWDEENEEMEVAIEIENILDYININIKKNVPGIINTDCVPCLETEGNTCTDCGTCPCEHTEKIKGLSPRGLGYASGTETGDEWQAFCGTRSEEDFSTVSVYTSGITMAGENKIQGNGDACQAASSGWYYNYDGCGVDTINCGTYRYWEVDSTDSSTGNWKGEEKALRDNCPKVLSGPVAVVQGFSENGVCGFDSDATTTSKFVYYPTGESIYKTNDLYLDSSGDTPFDGTQLSDGDYISLVDPRYSSGRSYRIWNETEGNFDDALECVIDCILSEDDCSDNQYFNELDCSCVTHPGCESNVIYGVGRNFGYGSSIDSACGNFTSGNTSEYRTDSDAMSSMSSIKNGDVTAFFGGGSVGYCIQDYSNAEAGWYAGQAIKGQTNNEYGIRYNGSEIVPDSFELCKYARYDFDGVKYQSRSFPNPSGTYEPDFEVSENYGSARNALVDFEVVPILATQYVQTGTTTLANPGVGGSSATQIAQFAVEATDFGVITATVYVDGILRETLTLQLSNKTASTSISVPAGQSKTIRVVIDDSEFLSAIGTATLTFTQGESSIIHEPSNPALTLDGPPLVDQSYETFTLNVSGLNPYDVWSVLSVSSVEGRSTCRMVSDSTCSGVLGNGECEYECAAVSTRNRGNDTIRFRTSVNGVEYVSEVDIFASPRD